MINSYEDIEYFIRQNKKPYLKLFVRSGHEWMQQGSYNNDFTDKESTIEKQTESAINWLNEYIAHFPDNSEFKIEMKDSKQGNQGAILTFVFMKVRTNEKPAENNITGLGAIPEPEKMRLNGYVHESEMKAKILEKELEYKEKINDMRFEQMRDEMNEKIKVVKETASTWSPENITNLAGIIAPFLGKSPVQTAISGTKDEPATDIKASSVNQLAEHIYKNMSLAQIESLKKSIIEKPEENE